MLFILRSRAGGPARCSPMQNEATREDEALHSQEVSNCVEAYQNRSLAMDGRKLIRRATSWRTVKMPATDKDLLQRKLVRHRRPTAKPETLPAPTIKVMAISIGVKCPDTTFAQPRRNSQIRVISPNQTIKHGSEAHFAISRRRSPSRIGTHRGKVWTICRTTPLLTMPTIYNASTIANAE